MHIFLEEFIMVMGMVGRGARAVGQMLDNNPKKSAALGVGLVGTGTLMEANSQLQEELDAAGVTPIGTGDGDSVRLAFRPDRVDNPAFKIAMQYGEPVMNEETGRVEITMSNKEAGHWYAEAQPHIASSIKRQQEQQPVPQ